MPAGRVQVDYTDIDFDAITLKIDNVTITYDKTQPKGIPAAIAGSPVVGWSADDTAQLVNDGDAIAGKLLEVFADNFCTVQFKGFMTLPAGASAVVTRGRGVVGALGPASARGYCRQTVSPGAAYVQAEQVEQNRTRGRIWNTADTTNVVVYMGA